jgi:hypothetical protein
MTLRKKKRIPKKLLEAKKLERIRICAAVLIL